MSSKQVVSDQTTVKAEDELPEGTAKAIPEPLLGPDGKDMRKAGKK